MRADQATPGTTFSQPIRALTTMLVVCALVAAAAWAMHGQIAGIVAANPVLNGLIAFVFVLGVLTCFWQVWSLAQSVSWIESVVRGKPGAAEAAPPVLLAPLAALLQARGKARSMTISATSGRSILDSVAQRVDEARDITRYLVNLLVFLGLLGTFWGLATTVPAVVETIRGLAPKEGETGIEVFSKLMGGLESQLGGMGTAFSSSLLGLAGSLVVGLLELFAGHGQNRFYRELEEWLSSITRIGLSDGDGNADQSVIVQVLDNLAGQMEGLQALQAQAEASRGLLEGRLGGLGQSLDRLATRLEAQSGDSAFLQRMAEGQDRLAEALARLAEGQERLTATLAAARPAEDTGEDPESRMRLRSIDVQLLRILEEISAGREEALADLRADLAAMTAAIRQAARTPPAPRG
ncbi:biopolymer transporter ExbB [Pseudogemmobacter blasticus]|uniref:Biopolymer transporter ExbB n=1 Tax=Fuscovulum blasticum DSM 2131 TaxID=1188250 RepID=A0A2T4J7R5_FUSBL|nr:biopolymer transporter ExbB [Fuscovulum blasticum]PTE13935.1 biopolymer transporter ExbB [Fuscovulum blasticum DSM 2131]